jgi:hypothetical protein
MKADTLLYLLLGLVTFVRSSPVLIRKRVCHNEHYCSCNWDNRKIECYYTENTQQANAFMFNPVPFDFSNKSFTNFTEIYLSNLPRVDQGFFRGSNFSNKFKLNIQVVKQIGKHFLANINGLKYLELAYTELKQIDAEAFDFLNCKSISLTAIDKNYPLNLNVFGSDLIIGSLQLDFNNLNPMKSVFINSDVEWLSLALKKRFNSNYLMKFGNNVSLTESDIVFSREHLIKYW